MTKYTFTTSGGSSYILIEPTKAVNKKIDEITRNVPIASAKYTEDVLYPLVRKKMMELIWAGGSNKTGFTWGYWSMQRRGNYKKGGVVSGGWQLVYPSRRMTRFSYSKFGSKKLPILPRSYSRYRKYRKKFKYGQFALFDSGRLITGFHISSSVVGKYEAQVVVGNKRSYLDDHEFGSPTSPKRQIVAPIHDWFINNKSLLRKTMTKIIRNAMILSRDGEEIK